MPEDLNLSAQEVTPEQPTSAPEASDWLLQDLITLVESGSGTFGITLCVGGILISGYLVAGEQYFDGIAEEYASRAESEEGRRKISDSFKNLGAVYYSHVPDTETVVVRSFIHLKDAVFIHNSGPAIPGNRGVWWRGRLSAVDGFMFGTLSSPTK